MNIQSVFPFLLIFYLVIALVATSPLSMGTECNAGEQRLRDCNSCKCANGFWACTKKHCISRAKRAVPVQSDLYNTPCAPNDYFKVDCNTCYCNIEKTGYLCTQNLCPPATSDNSTVPMVSNGINALNNISTAVDHNDNSTSTMPSNGSGSSPSWQQQTTEVGDSAEVSVKAVTSEVTESPVKNENIVDKNLDISSRIQTEMLDVTNQSNNSSSV